MISVKRKKRRSFESPTARNWFIIAAAVALIILAVGIFGLVKSLYLQDKVDDLGDYMAISIRTDLNQVLQSYDTMDRRSADLSGDIIPAMRRYMYSAYNMNRLLVTARGEAYSILDANTYNNFQTLAGEYEQLLRSGENTSEVAASMSDFMTSLRASLNSRFDSTGALIPLKAGR